MAHEPDERTLTQGHGDSVVGGSDTSQPVTRLLPGRTPAPPAVVSVPDGYDYLGPLGRGGMGVVVKARQRQLDRVVALKMLLAADLATEEEHARLQAEAVAVAALDHPNVVQIYEVGTHDDRPFIAFEFCGGGSLADRVRAEPLKPREAATVVEALARGVAAAHAKGIVHRDLKPANALLTEAGVPKVADFGLSKRIDSGDGPTRSGALVGTPSYMAPEQASGAGKTAGPAADVYALGAILYYALTGRPPFTGATVTDTLRQVLETDPTPPSRLAAVPRDLDTVCLKCLHKVPSRRYASAAALADDLGRQLRGEPIEARPVGPGERAALWVRRYPLRTAFILFAAVTLVTVPALVAWYSGRLATAAALAEGNAKAAEAANEAAAVQEYFSRLRLAATIASERKAGWSAQSLGELTKAAALPTTAGDPVELRTEAAAALCGPDLRPAGRLFADIAYGCLAYSPDGRTLAVGQQRAFGPFHCFIDLIERPGGARRQAGFTSRFVSGKALTAPDGPRCLAFSPDGRTLYAGTRSGWLHRWDIDKLDAPAASWAAHAKEVSAVAVSADGRRLYSVSAHAGTVKCWPADGTKALGGYESPALGRLVAVAADPPAVLVHDGGLRRLRPETLEPLGEPLPTPHGVEAVHAGLGMAFAAGERVHLLPADGPGAARDVFEPRLAEAFAGGLRGIAVHPGGGLLATSDAQGNVHLWEATAGRLAASAYVEEAGPVAFQPGGTELAVVGPHGTLLFDVTGRAVQSVVGPGPRKIEWFAAADGNSAVCLTLRELPGATGIDLTPWDVATGARGAAHARTLGPGGHCRQSVAAARGGPVAAFAAGAFDLRDAGGAWRTAPAPGGVGGVAVAPAGDRVWVVDGEELRAYAFADLAPLARRSNSLETMISGRGAFCNCVAAGDRWVLVGGQDEAAKLNRAADAAPAAKWPCGGGQVEAVALSADESLAAAGTRRGRVRLFAVPGGAACGELDAHRGNVTALAFAPGGALLASGATDRTVQLWHVGGGAAKPWLALRLPASVRHVAFAGDDCLLVLVQNEAALRRYDLRVLRRQLADMGL